MGGAALIAPVHCVSLYGCICGCGCGCVGVSVWVFVGVCGRNCVGKEGSEWVGQP